MGDKYKEMIDQDGEEKTVYWKGKELPLPGEFQWDGVEMWTGFYLGVYRTQKLHGWILIPNFSGLAQLCRGSCL